MNRTWPAVFIATFCVNLSGCQALFNRDPGADPSSSDGGSEIDGGPQTGSDCLCGEAAQCRHDEGNLVVEGACVIRSEEDLVWLNSAVSASISGSLAIQGFPAGRFEFTSLTSLRNGLIIRSIGSSAEFVFPELATIGSTISVFGEDGIESIEMESLTTVGGSLDIAGNGNLHSLLMPRLQVLGGAVALSGNMQMDALDLGSLESTGSRFRISASALRSLELPALTLVNGTVQVINNVFLPNCLASAAFEGVTVNASITVTGGLDACPAE